MFSTVEKEVQSSLRFQEDPRKEYLAKEPYSDSQDAHNSVNYSKLLANKRRRNECTCSLRIVLLGASKCIAPHNTTGTMETVENELVQKCPHLEVSNGIPAIGFWCRDCETWLGVEEITQWVKEAEKSRDEAHLTVKGDEFEKITLEERQREVYRRRKVMYEFRSTAALMVRPEMLLIVYDESSVSYECRVFYKEPRPVSGIERLRVEATEDAIVELSLNRDSVVRLVASKVEEFHRSRRKLSEIGEMPPPRRVFYAADL